MKLISVVHQTGSLYLARTVYTYEHQSIRGNVIEWADGDIWVYREGSQRIMGLGGLLSAQCKLLELL